MTKSFDLLLKNGTCATPNGLVQTDIGVCDGKITAIGTLTNAAAAECFDAEGLHVLPGAIDTQVHFREPGSEHKEDLESGSRAAVLGGITAVFEMPNTNPPTTTAETMADKQKRAHHRMHCDFAFFVGAAADNIRELGQLEKLPGVAGVKAFLGSSTGPLLLAGENEIAAAMASGTRRMSVHSEDNARLSERKPFAREGHVETHPEWRDVQCAVQSTQRVARLARLTKRPVHVLHVSAAEELPILAANHDILSVEMTPQHLTLSAPECYERLGTLAQMNPPIRDEATREALWTAIQNGLTDIIGSDHAPHTPEEKAKTYPASPSGMPGVQTLVPLMLNHVAAGRLSLERFVDLTSTNPARLFGIMGKGRIAPGYDADFTVVDLKRRERISNAKMGSRAKWTPFDNMEVTGWPLLTIVRGQIVMREGEILTPNRGESVRFF